MSPSPAACRPRDCSGRCWCPAPPSPSGRVGEIRGRFHPSSTWGPRAPTPSPGPRRGDGRRGRDRCTTWPDRRCHDCSQRPREQRRRQPVAPRSCSPPCPVGSRRSPSPHRSTRRWCSRVRRCNWYPPWSRCRRRPLAVSSWPADRECPYWRPTKGRSFGGPGPGPTVFRWWGRRRNRSRRDRTRPSRGNRGEPHSRRRHGRCAGAPRPCHSPGPSCRPRPAGDHRQCSRVGRGVAAGGVVVDAGVVVVVLEGLDVGVVVDVFDDGAVVDVLEVAADAGAAAAATVTTVDTSVDATITNTIGTARPDQPARAPRDRPRPRGACVECVVMSAPSSLRGGPRRAPPSAEHEAERGTAYRHRVPVTWHPCQGWVTRNNRRTVERIRPRCTR